MMVPGCFAAISRLAKACDRCHTASTLVAMHIAIVFGRRIDEALVIGNPGIVDEQGQRPAPPRSSAARNCRVR